MKGNWLFKVPVPKPDSKDKEIEDLKAQLAEQKAKHDKLLKDIVQVEEDEK
jgi:hypothetical protein